MARHLADGVAHVVDGEDAEVGQPHRRRERGAGEVQRFETLGPGLQRREPVVGAGDGRKAAAREQCTEAFAGGQRRRRALEPAHGGAPVT